LDSLWPQYTTESTIRGNFRLRAAANYLKNNQQTTLVQQVLELAAFQSPSTEDRHAPRDGPDPHKVDAAMRAAGE
jgi:hypothetical protein